MTADYGCGHWDGRTSNRWRVGTPASRLGEIKVPVLVVDGALDTPPFRAMAAEYAASLPAARRVSVPGAGHVSNMEAPSIFDALLCDFVRSAR